MRRFNMQQPRGAVSPDTDPAIRTNAHSFLAADGKPYCIDPCAKHAGIRVVLPREARHSGGVARLAEKLITGRGSGGTILLGGGHAREGPRRHGESYEHSKHNGQRTGANTMSQTSTSIIHIVNYPTDMAQFVLRVQRNTSGFQAL